MFGAGYLEDTTFFPKRMSYMAEMMYTWFVSRQPICQQAEKKNPPIPWPWRQLASEWLASWPCISWLIKIRQSACRLMVHQEQQLIRFVKKKSANPDNSSCRGSDQPASYLQCCAYRIKMCIKTKRKNSGEVILSKVERNKKKIL